MDLHLTGVWCIEKIMRFELTEAELGSFVKWNEDHLSAVHGGEEPYCGAIGGRLTFSFTCTSLGDITKVKCGLCKGKSAKHDMTDYSTW